MLRFNHDEVILRFRSRWYPGVRSDKDNAFFSILKPKKSSIAIGIDYSFLASASPASATWQ